jgi:hypothetical protein
VQMWFGQGYLVMLMLANAIAYQGGLVKLI